MSTEYPLDFFDWNLVKALLLALHVKYVKRSVDIEIWTLDQSFLQALNVIFNFY